LQCIYFHSQWWLGGRDDVVEGVWEWSSTGKPFSVSDWNPGQLYNLYQDQDCLRIWKNNMIITGMTVANIASLIDVMDLKYNEYRKKLNV
jgi:hypothetical protein